MSETATNTFHKSIEDATREYAALKPANARVAETPGLTLSAALKQRVADGQAVASRHGVTEDQITSYLFDGEYTYANGKKCKCADCLKARKTLRAHLQLERGL